MAEDRAYGGGGGGAFGGDDRPQKKERLEEIAPYKGREFQEKSYIRETIKPLPKRDVNKARDKARRRQTGRA